MKQNVFGTKTKIGIIVLLLSFTLLPISPSMTIAAEKVPGDVPLEGTVTAPAGTATTEGAAAGGLAGVGATTGLSTMTLVGIAAGAAVAGLALAAGSGGDSTTTTAHH